MPIELTEEMIDAPREFPTAPDAIFQRADPLFKKEEA